MNRREFLRNMLYGAAAAALPLPVLTDDTHVVDPFTVEGWVRAPHGSWVHMALVQHSDGSQTRYANAHEVASGSYHEMILRDWFRHESEIQMFALYDRAAPEVAGHYYAT